ncbi:hypothetical protein [Glycomyces sp. NPDC047010]|uniref:hypothetical protein n=1 Tax=Glycomyces sp. NPDC047010 TaxID=3155023 RepID=UPI0033CFFE79
MLLRASSKKYKSRYISKFRDERELRKRDFMQVGGEYIAFGMVWIEDELEVIVDKGSGRRSEIVSASISLFEVVDPRVPSDWYFERIGPEDPGGTPEVFKEDPVDEMIYHAPDAVMGYYELVYSPLHRPGLFFGYEAEIAVFRQRERQLADFYARG